MNSPTSETLLSLTNRVLMNAGEQPARTVNETIASKRASVCIKRAVTDLILLSQWSFTRSVVTPTSFNEAQRTISVSLHQVEDVWYNHSPLCFVDWQPHALSSIELGGGSPSHWTLVNYNTIKVAPYPVVEDRADIRIVGYQHPTPMVVDDDVPGVPGMFTDALVSRATGAFYIRHLSDPQLGNQFNNEFEFAVQTLRNLDRGAPRSTGSMYR